jgi:cytochrome c oxidase assembly factor CtaG
MNVPGADTRARTLRTLLPMLLLLAAPRALAAQGNPVTDAVRKMAAHSGKHLIDAAQAMPARKYGFKPTAAQMSFAELIVHIEGDSRKTCSSLSGLQPPAEEKLSSTDPKAKLVAALERSIDFCTSALAQAQDAKLNDEVSWYGSNTTRAMPTIGILTDWADHYGQQAMYLRLNGIIPPTAR